MNELKEKKERIRVFLEDKKYAMASVLLKEFEPVDVAGLLEEVEEEELSKLFRLLPKELAAEAFVEMDGDNQEKLIHVFSDKELRDVIDEMYLDDTVDMIEEMPANVVRRILKQTDSKMRKAINEVLKYPKDSAGSIMTIEYVDFKKQMTVEEAFRRIREVGVDKETIYTCYVIEPDRKLVGIVSAKRLLLSDKSDTMEEIMDTSYISVDTTEDKEEVAKKFDKYGLMAIPVVDKEQRLVGITTFDDAMDVIQEEVQEDFEIMAAMSPSENSYFKTSVLMHARNRIFWLLFLMLSATFTGIIISKYEKAFDAVPLLVSFIPMLMGTGGNCGSQSSTMIIRGMAVDDILQRDFFRVIWKETRIAFLVSISLAIVNGFRIYIMYQDVQIAIVLGLSLILTILLAKIMGSLLPMFAKLVKIDPAIMAAPLISTIVDTCSVFIYFNIALRMLPI